MFNLTFKGNGYIPISTLKEILHELDPKLTETELDGIIREIDEDGSGTVDFDGTTLKRYILI
jgi:Ca2+-binding EF-hand superfamily protein